MAHVFAVDDVKQKERSAAITGLRSAVDVLVLNATALRTAVHVTEYLGITCEHGFRFTLRLALFYTGCSLIIQESGKVYFRPLIGKVFIAQHGRMHFVTRTIQSTDASSLQDQDRTNQQAFRMLDLPAELRTRIYELVVIKAPVIDTTITRDHVEIANMLIQPPLCRVCRQVRNESLPIFYGANVFLTICSSYGRGLVDLKWLQQLDTEHQRMLRNLYALYDTSERLTTYLSIAKHRLGIKRFTVDDEWLGKIGYESRGTASLFDRGCYVLHLTFC